MNRRSSIYFALYSRPFLTDDFKYINVEICCLNNIHIPKLIRHFSLIFNTTCNSANLFNYFNYFTFLSKNANWKSFFNQNAYAGRLEKAL